MVCRTEMCSLPQNVSDVVYFDFTRRCANMRGHINPMPAWSPNQLNKVSNILFPQKSQTKLNLVDKFYHKSSARLPFQSIEFFHGPILNINKRNKNVPYLDTFLVLHKNVIICQVAQKSDQFCRVIFFLLFTYHTE